MKFFRSPEREGAFCLANRKGAFCEIILEVKNLPNKLVDIFGIIHALLMSGI